MLHSFVHNTKKWLKLGLFVFKILSVILLLFKKRAK